MHILLRILLSSHLALGVASTADFATTRMAIHHGAHEIGLAGNSAAGEAAMLISHVAMVEVLAHYARKDGHPKLATGFILTNAGLRGVLAVHNYSVYRSQKEKTQP